MSSASFYDNFMVYQVESGINERITGLYSRVLRNGLQSKSSVLEIGCGIGTLTYLLLRKIKNGNIESVDLSPKSIEFAKKYLKAPNLTLAAGDILQYQPVQKIFDRILMFDFLEHMPVEQHPALFQKLAPLLGPESLLLINLPNPAYILHDQEKNPAALQETDQAIYLAPLSAALEAASIDIVSMETWSVWVREDYQFIVARKRRDFKEHFISGDRNIFQKAMARVKRNWKKLIYRYPPK